MNRLSTPLSLSAYQQSAGGVAYLRIAGDVDPADAPQLCAAARQLRRGGVLVVYVDLADTTFVGSTLLGFLAQIAGGAGAGPALVLCRPTPMAHRILTVARLTHIASLRPDLPAHWPVEINEVGGRANPSRQMLESAT